MGNLENSINNSWEIVDKPEEDLVICDWEDCPTRGEYIYCYFDTCKNCDIYQRHLNHLGKKYKKEQF